MIVVADSSPLISLARIGRLNLLASLLQRIWIPVEVHQEVTVSGRGLRGATEVAEANWISVGQAREDAPPELAATCAGLGAGERGAILLAMDMRADLLLVDEAKARRIAREAGLAITGCLGVLETGARKGLVPDLRQAYIELLREGIRFDIGLLQQSLSRLGLPKL